MLTPLHVLHVDDNELDRQLVRDALEHEAQNNQFIVTSASSRSEFETQLAMTEYDIVLTDFNILGFEGLQVIDAVQAAQPAIPVIVVTGTGSEEVAVEAMKRGAADYVIKNLHHIRRLPTAIQSALERQYLRQERLRSEQALRTSEERLRAFANALPDLAFIINEDGRYIQALNAPNNLLYTSATYRIGKRVQDILPEAVAEKIMTAVRRTISTATTQTVEYQLELSIGMISFEGRTSLMTTAVDGKTLVVYVARDVTDRKEAELKLTRERNLLRTLIDNIPDYIFVKDLAGRFIASNTAHAAAVQLSPRDIIGKTADEVFQPDFVDKFHRDDATVTATRQALINEERLIPHMDGTPHWGLITKVPLITETGDMIGLVGISRDITDRKRAEEALRASEEHLRAVVDGTPVILFELDNNGVLTFLQGRGVSVFGGEPTTILGISVLEFFENAVPDIRELFQLALNGEETSSVMALGDVILDVRYSPLRDKQGNRTGIIGVATDITERLKTERLKIELEKEHEVVALKERFIATASHDFRTPLTIIKMNVRLLENYFIEMRVEQRHEKLEQINAQVDRMIQLLDDVLILSKANAGKLDLKYEQVALKSFCTNIWQPFQQLAEQTHVMEFIYKGEKDTVSIDANLVHYILTNLLSNAVKYTPVGGFVRFEVTSDSIDLIFRISDNGIGIPMQDISRLFEPFHRAVNTKGISGTGLGLSIVKSYVEAHHGRIEFISQEGQGTTFTVYIPSDP